MPSLKAVPQPTLDELMARPYPITIRELTPADGGGFVAFLPDFGHSASSACGDTMAEALANLEAVKRNLFAYHLKHKLPLPSPSPDPSQPAELHQLPLRIPEAMFAALKAAAAAEGHSVNVMLNIIIAEHLSLRTLAQKADAALARMQNLRLAPETPVTAKRKAS